MMQTMQQNIERQGGNAKDINFQPEMFELFEKIQPNIIFAKLMFLHGVKGQCSRGGAGYREQ